MRHLSLRREREKFSNGIDSDTTGRFSSGHTHLKHLGSATCNLYMVKTTPRRCFLLGEKLVKPLSCVGSAVILCLLTAEVRQSSVVTGTITEYSIELLIRQSMRFWLDLFSPRMDSSGPFQDPAGSETTPTAPWPPLPAPHRFKKA